MANTVSKNWTFDMGEKLSQMVSQGCLGWNERADSRFSLALPGPLMLLMLTWWCTRCKGRTVFCETSTPWFFCLFRHSKWKDALRPEKPNTNNCVHHLYYTTRNLSSVSFGAVLLERQRRRPHFKHWLLSLDTLPLPKYLYLQNKCEHHGLTDTILQASCKIKLWVMIFIFLP